MAKCKYCDADIIWITTKAGKPMPCEPGLIPFWAKVKAKEKVVTDDGDVVSCLLDGDPEKITGLGHMSHFATCPHADRARKKRKP